MKSQRSIGIFLLACSAICLTIAIQNYISEVQTAKAIADLIEEVEFESVRMPIETIVCGLVGIMLLVAGARLLFESMRKPKSDSGKLLS